MNKILRYTFCIGEDMGNFTPELEKELELASLGESTARPDFTKEELADLVHILCNLSPWLITGRALEILDCGILKQYIADATCRANVDLWARSRYANLSLQEFLEHGINTTT